MSVLFFYINLKIKGGNILEIVNSLPKKLSIADDVKNINNKLGNTDISTISDGTVTGAISNINSNLSNVLYIESFDSTTGTLVTKSADYTG